MKRYQRLLTVIVLAALSFGGSFTCSTSTHDHDDKPAPAPANPQR